MSHSSHRPGAARREGGQGPSAHTPGACGGVCMGRTKLGQGTLGKERSMWTGAAALEEAQTGFAHSIHHLLGEPLGGRHFSRLRFHLTIDFKVLLGGLNGITCLKTSRAFTQPGPNQVTGDITSPGCHGLPATSVHKVVMLPPKARPERAREWAQGEDEHLVPSLGRPECY